MSRILPTAVLVLAAPFVWLVCVIAMTLHLLALGADTIWRIWR